jgi:hypothetical protein
MIDDDFKTTTIVFLCFTILLYVIIGPSFDDFDNGVEKGKNDTVIMCVENPQQCKIQYDYLKLREKLGEY